jgi:hypothetical protein
VTERLREHCSFHLMCPMLEACFYGETAALQRAGARRPAKVDALHIDVEDFTTADAEFLSASDGKTYWAKPLCQKHPKRCRAEKPLSPAAGGAALSSGCSARPCPR